MRIVIGERGEEQTIKIYKNSKNIKPNPCQIVGHDHDWKDCQNNLWDKTKDKDKDFGDKWSKVKVNKSKSKCNN